MNKQTEIKLIVRRLRKLRKLQEQVIRLSYKGGARQEELARWHKISQSRVSQIVNAR